MTDRSLDLLIDEVVLGLASEADTARLEELAARDPEVAARLASARGRFAPLDETADDLPLPVDFWERLAPRLDLSDETSPPPEPETAGAEVIDLAPLRARLTRWRSAAVTGIAASLLLACLLGWSLLTPPDPLVVAVLLDDRGEAIALVESAPDNTTRVTLLERPDVPAGQVMQVWTKPEEDGPPVSLGLLSTGLSRVLSIEGLPEPHPTQLYEITFEPAGGSPTNLPTGPILGKGLAKQPVT
ncbi:anti-sigma factor [Alloyangia pacifica]|uniref:Anti-sigma-K factor RskA n=1 Tax=Alloyangia pacifica TaxID=311180 RepID=A0A1I6UUD3_9RHOB|nr:anti-sigma factor [Alloyangia pacifica]SDI53314.1 Anti-sigma-K factor RskA [Alloyangia pacifica]SFT04977.1 Anti-sigma-K factor RskA [Alloyangia pacifica]